MAETIKVILEPTDIEKLGKQALTTLQEEPEVGVVIFAAPYADRILPGETDWYTNANAVFRRPDDAARVFTYYTQEEVIYAWEADPLGEFPVVNLTRTGRTGSPDEIQRICDSLAKQIEAILAPTQ